VRHYSRALDANATFSDVDGNAVRLAADSDARSCGLSRNGQALLRLVRRQKLGIDPALHAGVLDLDPVPHPACSCELRAPGGSPQNGRVSGGCRPDVYAGTLQKDEIRGRHSTWGNLGRIFGGE